MTHSTCTRQRASLTVLAACRLCCPLFARASVSRKLSPPPIVSDSRMSSPSAASSRARAAACVRAPTSRRLSCESRNREARTANTRVWRRKSRAGGRAGGRGVLSFIKPRRSHPGGSVRDSWTQDVVRTGCSWFACISSGWGARG